MASFDFHHGAELIDRARRATAAWLAEGGTLLPGPSASFARTTTRPPPSGDGRF